MKKNVPKILAFGVVAMGVSEVNAAGVLVDAGFEGVTLVDDGSGVGKWNPFSAGPPSSFSITQANPRTGSDNLELSLGAANQFAGVFQDVSVLPGEEITVSLWHSAVSNAPTAIEIRIEWQGAGAEVARTGNATPSPGASYELFTLTETAPANADTARVVYAIQSFGGSESAVISVDDVSVTGVPELSSLLLTALGAFGLFTRRRSK